MIADAILSGRTSVLNDRLSSIYPVNDTKLICPKCGKEFTVTDETRYLYGKDYVCDWKCFLTPVKKDTDIPVQIEAQAPVVTEPPKVEKKTIKKIEVEKPLTILEGGVVDLFG